MPKTKPGFTFVLRLIILSALLLTAAAPVRPAKSMGEAAPVTQAALTSTVTLNVTDIGTGAPVTEYKFLLSVDNTGDPFDTSPNCHPYLDPPANTVRNPVYPDDCEWPSIRTVPGWAPIYTQGNQADLSTGKSMTLPAGKYLISVMADGYKLDGEHFTIPMAAPGIIQVPLHPEPLPTASMVIKVFEDKSMTNGQFDAPGEYGLAGFRVSLNDILGEITADVFGNPLCTEYVKNPTTGEVVLDGDGMPTILKRGKGCYSNEDGEIHIPNIGPIRYDVLVTPPDGETWIQTTTLEGSLGWDTWLQEGGTGLDNEFVVAGEPFPWTIFGYVKPSTPMLNGTGSIEGVIMAAVTYSPSQGGLPFQGDIWGGFSGTKILRPISRPWIALNDLQNGDTAIWVGQGNPDGSFSIPNVPAGNYFLSYWDEKHHFILDWVQVTVFDGEVADIGVRTMKGWFTEIYGTVFHDYNENGRRDAGEPGIPDYTVIFKDRDNTEIDRMSIASLTDISGYYELPKGYPMGAWMFIEAYNDLYRTTGVTYQTSNQPEETTVTESGVTVGILPILGQPVRVDWGVKFYDAGTNGGIGGTVFYDTVRAEDNAQMAGAEPWQPGIPGLTVNLYATVKNPDGSFVKAGDGSFAKGPLLATTVTETFTQPTNCVARDVDGNPVDFPVLPVPAEDKRCLEGPLMGSQAFPYLEVDGNYGFTETDVDPVTGEALAEPMPLPAGDYLVEVVIPDDAVGKPMFKVTKEEDLNVFDGDEFIPQIPPPPCAGALHTVNVVDDPNLANFDPANPSGTQGVYNPGLVDFGGSRYEGMQMPLCDVRLARLENGKAIAPSFMLFTDVPIPGKWKGYIIDDLNVSTNPLDLFFGELVGVPNVPIGLYDFSGRRVHTVYSDRHGVYEVLLPSTKTTNAPTPSGMFSGMFYIYGNDPGNLDQLDPNYNPQYRSIGTSFEVYPGVIVPSDLAPVQNGVSIFSPGSQFSAAVQCKLSDDTPEIYAVSKPYQSAAGTFTIFGKGFGADKGTGYVSLGTRQVPADVWTDTQIVVNLPGVLFNGPNRIPGAHQLSVTNRAGKSTVNGLTFHILGQGYNPNVYEVGDGKQYDPRNYPITGKGPIQAALDDAYLSAGTDLVVIYPGVQETLVNPEGFYLENPVVYHPVKIQGVGPGGVYPDGSYVRGAMIDGRGVGGDTLYSEWWRETQLPEIWDKLNGWDGSVLDGDGNPIVYEGAVITLFAKNGQFTSSYPAAIDGLTVMGGDQQGFPNNLNQIGGTPTGLQPIVVVQGGGIFVNGYARHLRITNNIIRSNGGAYGGAIRLGTPHVPDPGNPQKPLDVHNDNVRIANNRLLANGGTNLAGALGIFSGTNNYEVAYNDICGNFSAEYGGGISHYGLSPGGKIHHNRIYFNRSYDEGGGVMIAGELPANPTWVSSGAGAVDVYNNLIQANLANDDGGGLRYLMSGTAPSNVYNNIIVNNVSTHEGGGVALNDATNVRIYNNTIMKNITTATAMTSNGMPAPAGLSTARNSIPLQSTLPAGSAIFSNPVLFNNIFWDNRAGTWTDEGVSGIGIPGDPFGTYYWDMGVTDGSGMLNPTNSVLQVAYGTADNNLVGEDPLVVQAYDVTVRVLAWRGNNNFVGADIVAMDLPIGMMGDYHLQRTSPAINNGTASWSGVNAPNRDYDEDPRPISTYFDIGADEVTNPFPSTPVLFAATGGITPAATMTNKVYMPMLMGGLGKPQPTPIWTGETQNYTFDPTKVTVTGDGVSVWNSTMAGQDQEVYFTFTKVAMTASKQALILKAGGLNPDGTVSTSSHLVEVSYMDAEAKVTVKAMLPGKEWVQFAEFDGIEFNPGDQFGARAYASGFVEVFKNAARIGIVDLTGGAQTLTFLTDPCKIGVWFQGVTKTDSASFVNFGGGTVP